MDLGVIVLLCLTHMMAACVGVVITCLCVVASRADAGVPNAH